MKKLLLFVLAATALAACSTDTTQDLAPEIPTAPDELQVSFDEEDTRIQLQNGTTVWTAGDLVSVFYRSNAHDKYEFQGETGDTDGILKRISKGTPTVGLDKVVAVYPYNGKYLISLLSGNIKASLPAEQTYAEDSYGIGSSIMVSSSRTDKIHLKNVCGWLKLQFTSIGRISKIVLRGNNGEQVAGDIYINSDDASCTLASDLNGKNDNESGDLEGTLVDTNTILTELTLNCGDGVTLHPQTPTAFYIALPPQTFKKGLAVTLYNKDGIIKYISTENSITIRRNHITPIASTSVDMPIGNDQIWYTSSDGNIVKPYTTSAFGANITSNTYENGQGVITFDGEVTTIGKEAFKSCKSLTSVTIPDSVTTIGNYAFRDCDALTSVTIPDSVTTIGKDAFFSCDALTSVTIPDSVTTIGEGAFACCTSLTSITIPDSVTTIGGAAFISCDALKSVTIGDSVTTIGDSAFRDCDALTSVTIPDSVTTIERYAFSGCSSLTSVTIPDSVTTIGEYAFRDCSSLTSITIPDSVTMIWESAFGGCNALKAFYGKFASADNRCLIVDGVLNSFAPAGLTEYTIPDSVTTIGGYTFQYCSALTSVTIPDSVTSIECCAFESCSSLTSVTIPDSVTTIGNFAFSDCSALTNVTIGNGVTEIGNSAFRDCSSLTSVTIPDSVTTIGEYAFYSCSALKEVYCKPTTPPSLGNSSVFDFNASGRRIYVPTASVDAYKAKQNWSEYASAIYPYTFTE